MRPPDSVVCNPVVESLSADNVYPESKFFRAPTHENDDFRLPRPWSFSPPITRESEDIFLAETCLPRVAASKALQIFLTTTKGLWLRNLSEINAGE